MSTDRPHERSERSEREARDTDKPKDHRPKEDTPRDNERPRLSDGGGDAPGADEKEKRTKLKDEFGGAAGYSSSNARAEPMPKLGKTPEEWNKEQDEKANAERKRQAEENQAKLRAMARSGR